METLYMTVYNEWIKNNIPNDSGYGRCKEFAEKLIKDIPELNLHLVRGHYYCHVWGKREHWWCESLNRKIFDPTEMQFPSKGTGHYEPWDENKEEPTGMCMNCGEYCYGGNYFCSKKCENVTINDLGKI